jgi:streptogramin lyase
MADSSVSRPLFVSPNHDIGLAALLILAVWVLGCATPTLYAPATALVHVDPDDNPRSEMLLSLIGERLGLPLAAPPRGPRCGTQREHYFVRIRAAGQPVLEIESTQRQSIRLWSDRQIVLWIPGALAGAPELRIEVCTPGGLLSAVPVQRFVYDHFAVPRSDPEANPSPLAIAIDARSTVWVNEEFHSQVKSLSAEGEWSILDIPHPPGPGTFALTIFGESRSRVATFGESILVDPEQRVWLSEGGPAPYPGALPNHSRVLRIDPGNDEVTAYMVPGDNNGVIGLAFARDSGRIWFTQAKRVTVDADGAPRVVHEASLSSFDPMAIEPNSSQDLAPASPCALSPGAAVGTCSATPQRRCARDEDCTLAEQVCLDSSDSKVACFRVYPLPADAGVFLPGPMLSHSDGTQWYAGYWGGNHLGRLDPATGEFERFPLPRPPLERRCNFASCSCFDSSPGKPPCPDFCCRYQLLGRGPWGLIEERSGDIAFCGTEAGFVSRLHRDRIGDPRCTSLDATGANPCISDYPVPNFDPLKQQMHSLAQDAAGNIWFATGQGFAGDPASLASLGYLDARTERVILLPPLALFPYAAMPGDCQPPGKFVGFSGSGLAVDERTGAIWFADYCRKRLGRLLPYPLTPAAGQALLMPRP